MVLEGLRATDVPDSGSPTVIWGGKCPLTPWQRSATGDTEAQRQAVSGLPTCPCTANCLLPLRISFVRCGVRGRQRQRWKWGGIAEGEEGSLGEGIRGPGPRAENRPGPELEPDVVDKCPKRGTSEERFAGPRAGVRCRHLRREAKSHSLNR